MRRADPILAIAGLLGRVLDTAVAEHGVPLEDVSLPGGFYDMQYVALEIYEALREWAGEPGLGGRTACALVPGGVLGRGGG